MTELLNNSAKHSCSYKVLMPWNIKKNRWTGEKKNYNLVAFGGCNQHLSRGDTFINAIVAICEVVFLIKYTDGNYAQRHERAQQTLAIIRSDKRGWPEVFVTEREQQKWWPPENTWRHCYLPLPSNTSNKWPNFQALSKQDFTLLIIHCVLDGSGYTVYK